MKITITGSLGHISKPLTEELVNKGHTVIVISSSSERVKDIEDLGANAAVGSLEDADFLTETFNGADAVYCMIPPNNYFDQNLDLSAYFNKLFVFQSARSAAFFQFINIRLRDVGERRVEFNGEARDIPQNVADFVQNSGAAFRGNMPVVANRFLHLVGNFARFAVQAERQITDRRHFIIARINGESFDDFLVIFKFHNLKRIDEISIERESIIED